MRPFARPSTRDPVRRSPGRAAPRAVAAALACALAAASPGCGESSPPAPPTAPPVAPPTHTPPAPPAETVEQRGEREKAEVAEERARVDRAARAAIERFRERTFDPTVDADVVRASGRIRVDVDGRQGEYRFRYDGALAEDDRLETETVSEESGIHPESARQALRFAHLALHGPYAAVMSYLPPVQWLLVRADDGRMIVVAPPWRGTVGVSYRLDDHGIVVLSGTGDGERTSRTAFTWKPRGAAPADDLLLVRSVEDEGKAVLAYEYADRDGIPMLSRATLTEGEHRYDALVEWDEVVRAPADR